MTGHLENMANDLASEVLSEAADTFFGQRRDLEMEIDLFHQKVTELRELGKKTGQAQKRMHAVLLEPALIEAFYHALELPRPETIEAVSVHELAAWVSPPFAWSLRGRYRKLLLTSYAQFQRAAQVYAHGGYKEDAQGSRKRIARFGHAALHDWADRINDKIRVVNREQGPAEVLQFVKRLDVQACEKERCMGASCEVNRDNGLLFPQLDFSSYSLPVWPEMPPVQTAQQGIKDFCQSIFSVNRLKIRNLLRELAAQRKKRLCFLF